MAKKKNYKSTHFNPQKHHRRSIRLNGYDYSQEGLYFLTFCTQDRANLFGHIKNGKIILNDAGKMVEYWYYELENKFPNIQCHEMIIMPNHFHCIIEIVGADRCVCPNTKQCVCPNTKQCVCPNTKQCVYPNTKQCACPNTKRCAKPEVNLHASLLGQLVQWFKTITTNFYIHGVKNNDWKHFNRRLWQRNYWEHIIRSENEYKHITQYIINNPKQWENDQLKK